MNLRYLLIGWLLAAPPVAAQTTPGVLHPAQTIALGPHATLGGTVVLPNHNTVLLLTDHESPEIVAQCLAPDGHTLWKTTLTRYGQPQGPLYPLHVFASGNEVVLSETIDEETAKYQRKLKGAPVLESQQHVQRLDAQGQLTKQLFEPPAPPMGQKDASYFVLGRYAEATGYAELVQESKARRGLVMQGSAHRDDLGLAIYHYDLQAKALRREAFTLPPVPTSSREYRTWYTDWAFLGHRLGQLYFCRRSLMGDTKKRPGRGPLLYHVYITDEHGQAAPGGFSTAITLPPDTRVAYSGHVFHPGELTHLEHQTLVAGGHSSELMDSWDITTGGMGTFYLDYATGEVLVLGEYTNDELVEFGQDHILGVFARRYAPDGQLLAQSQTAYDPALLANKHKLSFKTNLKRQIHLHADPLTGQYVYSFAATDHLGIIENFDLFLAHDLHLSRYDYRSRQDQKGRLLTYVTFAQPFDLSVLYNPVDEHFVYEHADKNDPPVYAALEQLRAAAGVDGNRWFYLSPTGPSTGLVLERRQNFGDALRVYTF